MIQAESHLISGSCHIGLLAEAECFGAHPTESRAMSCTATVRQSPWRKQISEQDAQLRRHAFVVTRRGSTIARPSRMSSLCVKTGLVAALSLQLQRVFKK